MEHPPQRFSSSSFSLKEHRLAWMVGNAPAPQPAAVPGPEKAADTPKDSKDATKKSEISREEKNPTEAAQPVVASKIKDTDKNEKPLRMEEEKVKAIIAAEKNPPLEPQPAAQAVPRLQQPVALHPLPPDAADAVVGPITVPKAANGVKVQPAPATAPAPVPSAAPPKQQTEAEALAQLGQVDRNRAAQGLSARNLGGGVAAEKPGEPARSANDKPPADPAKREEWAKNRMAEKARLREQKAAAAPAVAPPPGPPEGGKPPPERVKGKPQTNMDMLMDQMDGATAMMEEGKAIAQEPGRENEGKMKQFAAAIMALGIVIQMIVMAFKGELMKKPKEEGGEGTDKGPEGKAAEAGSSSPEAGAGKDIENKIKDKKQVMTPENIQEAAKDTSKEYGEALDTNTKETGKTAKSIEEKNGKQRALRNVDIPNAEKALREVQNNKESKPEDVAKAKTNLDNLRKEADETIPEDIKKLEAKQEQLGGEKKTLEKKQAYATAIAEKMEEVSPLYKKIEGMITEKIGKAFKNMSLDLHGNITLEAGTPEDAVAIQSRLKSVAALTPDGKGVIGNMQQIMEALKTLPAAPPAAAGQKPKTAPAKPAAAPAAAPAGLNVPKSGASVAPARASVEKPSEPITGIQRFAQLLEKNYTSEKVKALKVGPERTFAVQAVIALFNTLTTAEKEEASKPDGLLKKLNTTVKAIKYQFVLGEDNKLKVGSA